MSLISGIDIPLGGKTYTIPPLNFAALKRLQPVIESLTEVKAAMSSAQIDGVVQVIQAAMHRNYPEIIADDILEWLDLGNAATILSAIMANSGIKPVGEPQAENASQSTGTGSTPI